MAVSDAIPVTADLQGAKGRWSRLRAGVISSSSPTGASMRAAVISARSNSDWNHRGNLQAPNHVPHDLQPSSSWATPWRILNSNGSFNIEETKGGGLYELQSVLADSQAHIPLGH